MANPQQTYGPFWTARFQEHASYLSQLLAPGKLKNIATQLYQRGDWNWNNQDRVWPTIRTLEALNKLIQQLTRQGKNVNDINLMPKADFAKLNDHMLEELQTFYKISDGKITAQDELDRYVAEIIQHLQLAGSLLKQQAPKDLARQIRLASQKQQWDDLLQLLNQANQSGLQLDQQVQATEGSGSLDDQLLQHENKEGEYETGRINQLIQQIKIGQGNQPSLGYIRKEKFLGDLMDVLNGQPQDYQTQNQGGLGGQQQAQVSRSIAIQHAFYL